MSKPLGKILVIRGGAIGDFILTLPVLAALREQFPETHIEVLGYAHIAELARAGGNVDAIRSIEARPLAGFFARGGDLNAELALYFSSFSIIISYLYDPDEIFKTNVARCSKAQFIVGPHRPNERERTHATEVFLKPLERLAIFQPNAEPQLKLGMRTPAIPLPPGRWLAVHPGSGSENKNWAEASWGELLELMIRKTDWQLLLVGGEAEGDRLKRLAAILPGERIKVLQSVSLVALTAALHQCMGYIGHDSGITHLASAAGVPNLVLWGESVEEIWRPRNAKTTILREAGGLKALTAARVLEAALSKFEGAALPQVNPQS